MRKEGASVSGGGGGGAGGKRLLRLSFRDFCRWCSERSEEIMMDGKKMD